MSSVTIQNVTKSFGNTVVLENFDAVFQNGEFITLLGPSGAISAWSFKAMPYGRT